MKKNEIQIYSDREHIMPNWLIVLSVIMIYWEGNMLTKINQPKNMKCQQL